MTVCEDVACYLVVFKRRIPYPLSLIMQSNILLYTIKANTVARTVIDD